MIMVIMIVIIIIIIITPARAQVCNVSMAFARRLQSGNPASQGDFVRIYKVLSTLASSCHADPIQTSTLSAALSKVTRG